MPDDKSTLFAQPLTSKNLPKLLFKAEVPEKTIQTIPAETLYLAVRYNGLSDSLPVLELATPEQCSLMFDLDFWNADQFDEEKFWNWLELPDVDNDVSILKKIISCCDLKLVAILIIRYVDSHSYTEPTEEPPAAHFTTPDKGYTWIHVKIAEPHRNFLLNRFLAAIFDYSPEIFYQLLAIPQVATQSILEEESLQEKEKRLLAEGFPDLETAWQINSPLEFNKTEEIPASTKQAGAIPSIEPLIYNTKILEPLASLIEQVDSSQLHAELSYIINAGLIRWKIPIYEVEDVEFLSKKIKGATNIGLELCMRNLGLQATEVYERYGLQKIYRFGLGKVLSLKEKVAQIKNEQLQELAKKDQNKFALVAGLREEFPQIPEKRIDDEKTLYKAIEKLDHVESILDEI